MAGLDSQVITVTDLIKSKVRETPDVIFVQYPATPKGRSDYVGYTVADVDRLADQAAQQYMDRGLKPEVGLLVCSQSQDGMGDLMSFSASIRKM